MLIVHCSLKKSIHFIFVLFCLSYHFHHFYHQMFLFSFSKLIRMLFLFAHKPKTLQCDARRIEQFLQKCGLSVSYTLPKNTKDFSCLEVSSLFFRSPDVKNHLENFGSSFIQFPTRPNVIEYIRKIKVFHFP